MLSKQHSVQREQLVSSLEGHWGPYYLRSLQR